MVIVASQSLADVEGVVLETATPEEMAYHVAALKQSLRTVLQLLVIPAVTQQ
ncbi:hypothetical protein ACFU99_08125 [Streptomyces sp. NPDC057654]|uniref:hypothetical protein n=1 Tax=Streptomyces sp. NPDC057654 TaxID=3346196 RepID=UPI0036738FF6